MDAKDYKIRCDKCQFKPYVYCEMCMIRTKLQGAIEVNRKEIQQQAAGMQICLNEIREILAIHKKQILRIIEVFSLDKAVIEACVSDIPIMELKK